MEQILRYIEKHRNHMLSVFNSMGRQSKIQATKVFNFIQNSFDREQFKFILKGKDFFSDDQNSTEMEILLESYYRITQGDQSKKFYLYRIQFTFDHIINILQFWLEKEPNLKIVYKQLDQPIKNDQIDNKQQGLGANMMDSMNNSSQMAEQNNEFDADDENMQNVVEQYRTRLNQLNQKLKQTSDQMQKLEINRQIEDISMKIKVIEQRIKTVLVNQVKKQKKQNVVIQLPAKQKQTANSTPKRNVAINYKAIFDFYAKQTHLTGVKATFQRIQHESQSVNYQKLVHFLRQFNLLPSDSTQRKKVHGLYIKYCQPTRDLSFEGFMNVVDGVACLLFQGKTKEERSQLLKQKIYQKNIKSGKILNHPFHSLEKQDFRIDVNELKYNFKLKPQDGKFIHEVNNSIEKRRKEKEEAKTQRSKQKQVKQIRYLRKLQSIDPFSPELLKNSKLLQQKAKQCEPIASLQNIEKYRDHSFNFQSYLGIQMENDNTDSQKTPRRNNSDVKRQYSQRYKKGEQTHKRVEKLEKEEASKMQNIMSGIIERTNAKMQKLGISESKLERSIKFI